MKRILILDDSLTICLMLKSWLVRQNYRVDIVTSVEEAKQKVKNEAFDLILSDIRMPESDGFSFLAWVKKFDSDILVIMMTGFADIGTAVESMKSGAVDYIAKPIETESLYEKIANALKNHENQKSKDYAYNQLIKPAGTLYKKIFEKLSEVIHNDSHLLIIGESGTGKTSAANYIYSRSRMDGGAFIAIDLNSPALNWNGENGTNEQLFSHAFEQAKGGLLVVKNIQKADINTQASLLKALTAQKKDKDFVQIVITTQEKKERLNTILLPKLNDLLRKSYIELPTLQGNKEAISLYSEYFLELANKELDKKIRKIESDVMDVLYRHTWTGNIQELKNQIFKACLLSEENVISKKILPMLFKNFVTVNSESIQLKKQSVERLKKENYEKEKIAEALEIAKGNKTVAASILNIDRKTLYNKIKLYEVEID